MTNPPPSSEAMRCALSDDPAIKAVRRHAFRAIMEGRPATPAELATAATLPTDRIERAIAELRDAGALELDPENRVIGAHGLTQSPSDHTLASPERTWHTWCALDAIGIPVALRLDARIQTRCPTCGATIDVVVRKGIPTAEPEVMLWQPAGPCSHVMDDFCAAANLFCSTDHLERWHARAGTPSGRVLTLPEVAEEGRHTWSDIAHAP